MLTKINKLINKNNIKQLTDIRVIGLVMFCVVVLLVAWSSVRVLELNYDLQKKEAVLRQKNEIQKLENENLKLKNTYFESDEYLELTSRRQLNKAKKGEKLYIVPQEVAYAKAPEIQLPKTIEQKSKESVASQSKFRSNFKAWVDFLFNRGEVNFN